MTHEFVVDESLLLGCCVNVFCVCVCVCACVLPKIRDTSLQAVKTVRYSLDILNINKNNNKTLISICAQEIEYQLQDL